MSIRVGDYVNSQCLRCKRIVSALSVVLAGCNLSLISQTAAAQAVQFSPEVDVYINLHNNARLSFQAGRILEEGAPTQAAFGSNLEVYLKPLLRLRTAAGQQPDQSKLRTLTLSMGYRYFTSVGTAPENRIVLEASPRFPLAWKIVLTDRNRGDLRMIAGNFSWRYRNRLSVERAVFIHSYAFTPYLRAEAYYDSHYSKWSATLLTAGVSFPIKKHTELEPYYQHLNQTGRTPNQQLENIGLKLNLYF
ncbi:MAG TPA: DUF2490 domain-containing protein [Terriglobales bacterium]|jgi:hypothetical protein